MTMPTRPVNRAARRAKPAPKTAPAAEHVVKPKPQEKRIAELESEVEALRLDLGKLAYLHTELSVFVKAYVARDMAAKMAPAVQSQLEQKLMAQMSGGMRV